MLIIINTYLIFIYNYILCNLLLRIYIIILSIFYIMYYIKIILCISILFVNKEI